MSWEKGGWQMFYSKHRIRTLSMSMSTMSLSTVLCIPYPFNKADRGLCIWRYNYYITNKQTNNRANIEQSASEKQIFAYMYPTAVMSGKN